MSRIDELIAELCPGGVEFRTLGEIGELVRGNGMPKTDFTESGVGAIHYGQIYTYYGTWATRTISFVCGFRSKANTVTVQVEHRNAASRTLERSKSNTITVGSRTLSAPPP